MRSILTVVVSTRPLLAQLRRDCSLIEAAPNELRP